MVRRGQNADVGLKRLVAAEALETLILQHAQHFRLQGRRHIADFIEKQRAAIALLELADAAPIRAGECAFFVSE